MKTNVDFLRKMSKGIAVVVMVMTGLGYASAATYDGIRTNHAGECITCSSNTSLNDIRDNNLEYFLLKASKLKESMILTEEAPVVVADDNKTDELGEMLLKASELKEPLKIDETLDATGEVSQIDQLGEFLVQASGLNDRFQIVSSINDSDDLSLEEFLIRASGLKVQVSNLSQELLDEPIAMND